MESSSVVRSADGRTLSAVDDGDPSGRLVARLVACGDRVAVIDLTGELTRGTSRALVELLRGLLDAPGHTVRIRMMGLGFLDARGLAALVVAAKMAAEAGAKLVFVRPSSMARRLLELGGLSGLCDRVSAPAARPDRHSG